MLDAILKILTLIAWIKSSKETTITYEATDEIIFNPERGFYIHTEVFSKTTYTQLDLTTLNSYKSDNHSIILRVFYLENFLTLDISSTYLTNVQSDFNVLRQAGLKCIVRFAYSNSDQAVGSFDPTKTQMLSHINQLEPLLKQNSDVIYVMQVGLIGAWGEWYYTDNFGYPTKTSTDLTNRKDIVLALLSALPSNRMVQIRTPFFKKTFFSTLAITESEAYSSSSKSRVGHHNDCFLASSTDFGTYEDINIDYPYLATETLYTPMGGETCAVNPPRSQCTTALDELKKFHWSYLNIGYNGQVIDGFKTDGCFTTIKNKLGYRFELQSASLPDKISSKSFSFELKIMNNGFASLFNERKAYLVMRETSSSKEYSIQLKTNPRFWFGSSLTTISESLELPSGVVNGKYNLFLNLPDANDTLSKRKEYSIRFSNKNLWESSSGYNSLLHVVEVTSRANSLVENSKIIVLITAGLVFFNFE